MTKKIVGGGTTTLTTSQVGTLGKREDINTLVPDLNKFETQSEFSAVTNESDIRPEENCLDLVIQDAEYYYDSFRSVLDEKEMMMYQKTLITFVTVDFYNHDTETSQLAEGYRPLYNT